MPIYGKPALTEEEKIRLGRRLTYYLEEYIYHHKVTAVETAKRLGVTANKFSLLKGGQEQGRFISSLDYLKGLAKLEDMELVDFMAFLEERDLDKVRTRSYTWDEQIYKSLDPIGIHPRKQFANKLEEAAQDKKSSKVELVIELATALLEVCNEESLKGLLAGFKALKTVPEDK